MAIRVLTRGQSRTMTYIKSIITIFFTALITFSLILPASSATRVYNAQTNKWETPSERTTSSRRSSSIKKEIVTYETKQRPGTIIVETSERRLYLVLENGKALKYGVGVGREGFTWSGTNRVTRKAEWPGWTPPAAMRKRQPELPAYMPGGLKNPLGARAIYIGSTLYRLHGTIEDWSIGQAVSSGCIRLTNDDVTDLYSRVKIGAKVIVRR